MKYTCLQARMARERYQSRAWAAIARVHDDMAAHELAGLGSPAVVKAHKRRAQEARLMAAQCDSMVRTFNDMMQERGGAEA